jgi:protein TonB
MRRRRAPGGKFELTSDFGVFTFNLLWGPMRTRTFFVSLFVHALMIAAAIVAPIVATDELPKLRETTTFVAVIPDVPTVPPPRPIVRPPGTAAAANPNAAPVVEPPAIGAEPVTAPIEVPIGEGLIFDGGDLTGAIVEPPAVISPPAVTPVAPVPVGGAIRAPQKVHHVAPEYPAIARSARITGIVILEAVLGEDGAVRDVRVLRSVPLLDGAAVEAVRQWRFTPTLLNGAPVPVVMTVTVAFNLN